MEEGETKSLIGPPASLDSIDALKDPLAGLPAALIHRCRWPRLRALVQLVRPFQLNRVSPNFLSLPRADVTDFTIRIVIPTLAGNRVRNRLAQLVRRRRGKRIKYRKATRTPGTTWIRHHRIENLSRYVVVISTETRAGRAASLHDLHTGRQIDEVKRIRRRTRNSGIA
jgi:hypothetical protein